MATASARNHDYVLGLGADRVIDYPNQDFTRVAPARNVVFDTIAGEVHRRSFSVLRPGGRLVHIAAGPAGFRPPRTDARVTCADVRRDRRHLERIVELVQQGAVRPPEIKRLPLAEPAAHELSQTGHVRGKIVLEAR